MNKTIVRHLMRKGVVLAKRADESQTFSERAPEFFKWFEESVMNFDSEEYRKEFWRETYRSGRTIGEVPYTLEDHFRRKNVRNEVLLANMLAIGLLMGGAFAIWVIRRKIDQHIHRLRRPSYYENERNRRLRLTQDRRRIRSRSTNNPCPTADELRQAFKHARDSVESMIRIGSLMEDLECYVDNSLVFGEYGQIIARNGGIRRYIQSEIPDLYPSYKTLMRYKALAKKFRQAVGIGDPVPAASVLPAGVKSSKGDESKIKEYAGLDKPQGKERKILNYEGMARNENMIRTNSCGEGMDVVREAVVRRVEEILSVCEGTFLDLAAVLALNIGEDTIPHLVYHKISCPPLRKTKS